MDNQKNLLTVDFANNQDLKALMQGWAVGEEYDLKMKLQLNELTPDGAKFSIKEVTSEEMAEPNEEITPDNEHPVMAVMTAGTSSTGAPASAPEPYVAP